MKNSCYLKQNTPSPCGRVGKGAAYIKPAILVVELDLEGSVAQMFNGSKSSFQSINPTGVKVSYEADKQMGIYTDDFGGSWLDGAK